MADLSFTQGSDPVEVCNSTSGNIAAVNSDGTMQDRIYGNVQSGSYPDPGVVATATHSEALLDAFNNFQVRGPVLTDEGSLRDDFVGSSLPSNVWTSLTSGSGSTITVSSSIVNITAGTGASAQGSITSAFNDFGPLHIEFYAAVSQRIVNQTLYLSMRNNNNNPTRFVEFQFSGTTNTQVICATGSDNAAASQQTVTVTLPNSGTTNNFHDYSIEIQPDQCTFFIDNIVVAILDHHIPGPYDTLNGYIACVNSAATASATTLQVDFVYFTDLDQVDIQNKFTGNPVWIKQPKDNGRVYVSLTADAVAGVTSETLLTFTINKQGVTTSGTNYTIPNLRTLRITSIILGVQSGAASASWTRIKLRHNPSGATTTSSPLVFTGQVGTNAALAATVGQESVDIDDGLEILGNGTQTIALTHISSATTNVESVTLIGFEY